MSHEPPNSPESGTGQGQENHYHHDDEPDVIKGQEGEYWVEGEDFIIDPNTGEIIWNPDRSSGEDLDPGQEDEWELLIDEFNESGETPILLPPESTGTHGLGGTGTNRNPLLNRPPANGISNTTRKGLMTT